MPFRRELNRGHLGLLEDWQGNNIALACPACLKVFVVSGLIHRKGRECPNCRKTKAFVSPDAATASVECGEANLPFWKED